MRLPVHATPWITLPMVALAVVMGTLPFWIERVGLYPYLGIEVAVWMLYALGFNLLLGLTGLPSFGHGAYFGIGAYAFGLSQIHLLPSLPLGLAMAILAAAAAGALAALFVAHRRGIYFAFMTIAIGQVFWFVAVKAHAVTGGEDGLQGIARPPLLGFPLASNTALYWLCAGLLLVAVVLLWRFVQSPLGKALAAIRQNETRATFVGYPVRRLKALVFTLSAAIAGLAGALFAMAQQSAYPDVMSLHASGVVVMMTLVGGGLVSFWGPVIGVAVYFVARDVLGAYTETWLLWYGLLFMALVLFKPEGLAGLELRRPRLARRPGERLA